MVPCCKVQLCQLDQLEIVELVKLIVSYLAGHELVNQHGQAGQEAGLAGYELVNQHGQVVIKLI